MERISLSGMYPFQEVEKHPLLHFLPNVTWQKQDWWKELSVKEATSLHPCVTGRRLRFKMSDKKFKPKTAYLDAQRDRKMRLASSKLTLVSCKFTEICKFNYSIICHILMIYLPYYTLTYRCIHRYHYSYMYNLRWFLTVDNALVLAVSTAAPIKSPSSAKSSTRFFLSDFNLISWL